mgnify:FL=1
MKKYVYVFGVLWLIAIGVPLLFNPTIALGVMFFLSCICVPFWATELEKIEKYELYSEQYAKLYANNLNRRNFDGSLIIGPNRTLIKVKSKRDIAFEECQENYVTFRFSPIVMIIWFMLPLFGHEAPFEVVWRFWKTIIL